jgi:hypothetical protein
MERRFLQCVIAVLAAAPVLAGLEGVISGPSFLTVEEPWPVDLDSHMRFLSGALLAIGVAWYSCIPSIDEVGGRFRLLAALTFAGGLARLASLIAAGAPSAGHLYGLAVELVAVPLLVFWQARVASRCESSLRRK